LGEAQGARSREEMTAPDRIAKPKGILFDLGGTLIEEWTVDVRAGNAWLLSRASLVPAGVTLDGVLERAERLGQQIMTRRDETQIEVPWSAVFRLIYGHFGVEFTDSLADLELGFWRAAVRRQLLPGVREALDKFVAAGLPLAIVSNITFSERTLRAELEDQGLAHHFKFILSSADLSIRKPDRLIFELAAARLGIPCADIYFVGDRLRTDVAGANTAGMTSVLLTAPTNGDSPHRPALRISGWHEWPH
jgi:HAD superfamily hydrolase (TIGR01662 family)